MTVSIVYDTKGIDKALKEITFTADEFLGIEKKGAGVLIDGMKQRAARDSGEMAESVKQHIVKSDLSGVEDDIGPEVSYAIYQEYGTGIYAENGNGRQTPWVYRRKDGKFITTRGNRPHPFVRPAAREDKDKVIEAIDKEFARKLMTKWPK